MVVIPKQIIKDSYILLRVFKENFYSVHTLQKLLTKYTKKNGWHTIEFDKPLSARKAVSGKSRRRKTEVLTANYSLKTSLLKEKSYLCHN